MEAASLSEQGEELRSKHAHTNRHTHRPHRAVKDIKHSVSLSDCCTELQTSKQAPARRRESPALDREKMRQPPGKERSPPTEGGTVTRTNSLVGLGRISR